MTAVHYTLGDIAGHIGATLSGGDANEVVTGLATLQDATPGQLSFLANPGYRRFLASTRASAVILNAGQADSCPVAALVCEQPYQAYARVSRLFAWQPREPWPESIHPTATVHPAAEIGPGCRIGPHCVIESGVRLGAGSTVGAGTFIGEDTWIGEQARIYPRVVIYHQCRIGHRVILHAGAVIGADGFGHAPSAEGYLKIEQLGGVLIGDDVEVGANTTIDRGALGDTVIAEGVKLDNQIQIAHNVRVGAHTVIAGCAGISGSSEIGSRCMIGGGVGIAGHLHIGDQVHLTGMTLVTRDLREPGVYSSGTAAEPNSSWRRNVARFRQLDRLVKRLLELERNVQGRKDG